MRLASLFVAAVVAGWHSPSAMAEEVSAWLLKVSQAARQSNYRGVMVYRDDRMMEVLRIVHRHKDGREQERLTSLTGQPRDVLREDGHIACIVSGESGPVIGASAQTPQGLFPVMSQQTLTEVARHYHFRDLGQARVAGRSCRSVVMAPRDEFRYGYEVCADTATAVPLQVSLLDRRGLAVEQLMFTEVEFPATIADAAFSAPPGLRAYAPGRQTPAQPVSVPSRNLAQLQLPPGFRVIMRLQEVAPGGGVVEHVLLSDGLSAVSVFGAPVTPQKMFSGFSRMGAMNAYGRRIGGFHITVVGEVPRGTVRLIGDSYRPAPAEEPSAAPDSDEGPPPADASSADGN